MIDSGTIRYWLGVVNTQVMLELATVINDSCDGSAKRFELRLKRPHEVGHEALTLAVQVGCGLATAGEGPGMLMTANAIGTGSPSRNSMKGLLQKVWGFVKKTPAVRAALRLGSLDLSRSSRDVAAAALKSFASPSSKVEVVHIL